MCTYTMMMRQREDRSGMERCERSWDGRACVAVCVCVCVFVVLLPRLARWLVATLLGATSKK